MIGEKTFVSAINLEWFRRHNNRKDVTESASFAELVAFATYNSINHRAPCWRIEHELKQLIDHYEEVMGWKPREVKWAYRLATKKLLEISIHVGYLEPPLS